MTPSQIIVLATPVFLLLIGLELAWGWMRQRRGTGRNTYRLNDAINSISLGVLSQISAVFTRLLRIAIYGAVAASLALVPTDTARAFWNTWYGVLLALLFYDFCYYWLHRMGHECAVLWAAHVVHHQSQDYNLSTALRQTSSGALLGWIFYVPMALAGVPSALFAIVALVDLLYQFWVHTEHVPKLGWFDRVFCSPSNHRVHHAVNDQYLDKNYGGILILWDRLFGTFKEEGERCVYGTRSPLNSWDPLWSNVEVYWSLWQDAWHARSWGDKLRVWLKPPGWRPPDVAERFPKAAFDMRKTALFHPLLSRRVTAFAALQFVLLLAASSVFLWRAESFTRADAAVWLGALLAGLWALGAVLQGRLTVLQVLLVEACALATASSATGLLALHHLMKPLAMVIAIVFVAFRDRQTGAKAQFDVILMSALAASLVGDVMLMLPGQFIAGLLSFLVAHLLYLALFRQGVGWFPNRRALALTLTVGAAMYLVLWNGLSPALKVPVAVYVGVIALMAAQAIGRAGQLRDRASTLVAVGAGFFMLSDALLALNRFVTPLPMAQVWVLSSYYAAQVLIASHARPAPPPHVQ